MSEEILVLHVIADSDEFETAVMSKDQAIDVLANYRDNGIVVLPVAHGYRALFVGTQSEPRVYTDFLDLEAVTLMTGGAL